MSSNTFSSWSFLSKHGVDPYINMLAQGVHCEPTTELDYDRSTGPIVLRGILKHKLMQRCRQDGRDFIFVDTGYFGNEPTARNPQAHKLWHRIVINDIQHGDIVPRPQDRWQRFARPLPQWRRGRRVIVALPDDKPCKFYGIDRQTWIANLLIDLQRNTDRPIVLRERVANRQQRMIQRPLSQELTDDVHALVTFNSNAAVEAILHGVPAFVLAPSHAARPVSRVSVTDIETPFYPDQDLLYQWLCHLAYGQFHVSEMRSGAALQQISEDL
jgi:hypothetical protein